jgi:hypothetical protein
MPTSMVSSTARSTNTSRVARHRWPLWIDFRFPALTPGLRIAFIHVGVAIVVGQLLVPVLSNLGPLVGKAGLMFLLFLIALPALVYCCLTSVWVIENVQGTMRCYR